MARPQALVVADSDSYLKWAVARALELQAEHSVEVVVVRTAVTPSASQQVTAVDGRLDAAPAEVTLAALVQRLRVDPPDVLVLACRGPFIELLLLEELRGRRPARVVATGVPGIWYPPTELGLRLRAACDLMVVHSERERAAVDILLPRGRLRATGLASLISSEPLGHSNRPRLVFAPQAMVPAALSDRIRLLDALIDVAHSNPGIDVVIKLRGTASEAQTHEETASYETLARDRTIPDNLEFRSGPLREQLGACVGFVTVSSTAVLEAIAAGVPSLVLDEFGVGADVINLVFEGSGLLGGLEDLTRLDFRAPKKEWSNQNYFHATDDWLDSIRAMTPGPEEVPMVDSLRGPTAVFARIRRRAIALGAEDVTWVGAMVRTVNNVAGLRGRLGSLGRGTPVQRS